MGSTVRRIQVAPAHNIWAKVAGGHFSSAKQSSKIVYTCRRPLTKGDIGVTIVNGHAACCSAHAVWEWQNCPTMWFVDSDFQSSNVCDSNHMFHWGRNTLYCIYILYCITSINLLSTYRVLCKCGKTRNRWNSAVTFWKDGNNIFMKEILFWPQHREKYTPFCHKFNQDRAEMGGKWALPAPQQSELRDPAKPTGFAVAVYLNLGCGIVVNRCATLASSPQWGEWGLSFQLFTSRATRLVDFVLFLGCLHASWFIFSAQFWTT